MQGLASTRVLHDRIEELRGRDVFVWGAGQQGRGLCGVLQRENIPVTGVVDSSPELQGTQIANLPVHAPADALRWSRDKQPPFVIATAFYYDEEIIEQCVAAGLKKADDVISYKDIKPYDYQIDVSGVCNLRCLACPRSDRFERHPSKGYMSVETFRQVLDKILREDPLVGNVQLYQWGEPLLNPQLPEIIHAANDRGVKTAISSNMSVNRDLEPIIAAGPGRFRVSVSGTGAEYEAIHVYGQWKKLHRNLLRLGELKAKYNPEMKTEVYYHVYKHNQGASVDTIRAICREFDFEFHPVWAYLISLDNVLEHLEGKELSVPEQQAEEILAISLSEGMQRARAEKHKPCPVLRCIPINWDCSVSICMMYFYPQNNVATKDFLTTPLHEIVGTRDGCDLCQRCTAQGLHRYCSSYATQEVPLTQIAS
ncbi:MAG TPA: radical SAM protein [Pirellulaceae bacterium]|nr:radical SAM protein [Pirellulaceae bacterium]